MKVYQELKNQSVEAYLPLEKKIRQWSDRKKKVEEPMIRSYVFVKSSEKEYYDILNVYKNRLDTDELTIEEYEEMALDLQVAFTKDNQQYINIIFAYYSAVAIYFFVGFSVINYVYHLIFKGQTVGRKLMKIELYGTINWYTLLLREFLWKSVYWVFTLSTGIAIDLGLIAFTSKKKTIRDYLSYTELRHSGPSYPF